MDVEVMPIVEPIAAMETWDQAVAALTGAERASA
jgi:hypothetical protein